MIAARRQVPQRHRTTLGRARKVPQIPPTARDQGRERDPWPGLACASSRPALPTVGRHAFPAGCLVCGFRGDARRGRGAQSEHVTEEIARGPDRWFRPPRALKGESPGGGNLLEEAEPWTAASVRSAVSLYAGLRGRASVKDTSGRADPSGRRLSDHPRSRLGEIR